MPRERFDDPTTEGRYTQVSWRRQPGLDPDDQGAAPGYVQVSVHSPDDPTGEFADLDEAGIDRAIKALHKAKRQAFGPSRAERADEASRAYDQAIKNGVNPHKARRDAWRSAGYSDDEIAAFDQALTDGR